jgi:hypothetical protein
VIESTPLFGIFRTWRDDPPESAMRAKADIYQARHIACTRAAAAAALGEVFEVAGGLSSGIEVPGKRRLISHVAPRVALRRHSHENRAPHPRTQAQSLRATRAPKAQAPPLTLVSSSNHAVARGCPRETPVTGAGMNGDISPMTETVTQPL